MLAAVNTWPQAALAIAGVAGFTVVISVIAWQIFATGRTGIASHREGEYRKLVEELTAVQRDTTGELQRANDALAQLRAQTQELEAGLQEVDRLLKTVE
jgi:hypothetical protein